VILINAVKNVSPSLQKVENWKYLYFPYKNEYWNFDVRKKESNIYTEWSK